MDFQPKKQIFKPKHSDYSNKVHQSFQEQKFMGYIGAKLVDLQPGFCEIHLPFRDVLTQQDKFFHAGIIGSIADNTAGYAGFSLMEASSAVLTVEFKLNLLSPADGDLLIGTSSVLKHGRTLTVCRSDVFIVKNNVRKLCACSQSTLIELKKEN